MAVDLRLPSITAPTPEGQLEQIKSYLYQMTRQLSWAFESMDAEKTSVISASTGSSSSGTGAEAEFNEIKSLIIKSADIANAYYDQFKYRMDGRYVSQSTFGTYRQDVSAEISANATAITQLYTNLQTLSSQLEEVSDAAIAATAYLKSGLLAYDEDGSPIYGLEIGQRNTVQGQETFDRFARFTPNKLSFYDNNDVEVAYISDYKLHITSANITGTLVLGGYQADTSNGILFRWIGR